MIKISNVNYINTLPYCYAFENSVFIQNNTIVTRQNPAGCAFELKTGGVDIGLVPVGALHTLSGCKLIDDYGICAKKQVDSVSIFSDVPLKNLSGIYLDYQSKSSNGFVKILEKYFWKIGLDFYESTKGYENSISGNKGGLVIGDRALKLRNKFKYNIDIANEWYKFSGLPAVFALWVANNNISNRFIDVFKLELEKAVENKSLVADKYAPNYLYFDLKDYLLNKIYYQIGVSEKKSMQLYLELLKEILV